MTVDTQAVRVSRTACVIPAAGSGQRLGGLGPKALVLLAGEPLIVRAVAAVWRSGAVGTVVVAVPADRQQEFSSLLTPLTPRQAQLVVVVGGEHRHQSVAAGLQALPAEVDVVLVHDAARCLAPANLFRAVSDVIHDGAVAVTPAVQLIDTVKRVSAGVVVATVDRADLVGVQTPQAFRRATLTLAHRQVAGGAEVPTDDASMVERNGEPVVVVPGCARALKITHPIDLVVAEALLAQDGES